MSILSIHSLAIRQGKEINMATIGKKEVKASLFANDICILHVNMQNIIYVKYPNYVVTHCISISNVFRKK